MYLLYELARGSAGAMTGFAYPEVLVAICRHMAEGDKKQAEEVFYRHLPLLLFEFQEGIGVGIRKYALQQRGLISCPGCGTPALRLPRRPDGSFTNWWKRWDCNRSCHLIGCQVG